MWFHWPRCIQSPLQSVSKRSRHLSTRKLKVLKVLNECTTRRRGTLPHSSGRWGPCHRGAKQCSVLSDRRPTPQQRDKIAKAATVQASLWPYENNKKQALQAEEEKSSAEQFLMAAERAPRRHKSRVPRSLYTGPTARKDAEEVERRRAKSWQTNRVAYSSSAGAVFARAVRWYQNMISITIFGCPTELVFVTDYLQARLSEQCIRGAPQRAHRAISSMEEVAGVLWSAWSAVWSGVYEHRVSPFQIHHCSAACEHDFAPLYQ